MRGTVDGTAADVNAHGQVPATRELRGPRFDPAVSANDDRAFPRGLQRAVAPGDPGV